jgi:hypothetical protein
MPHCPPLKQTQFFSIILNTSQDTSEVGQVCKIYHYGSSDHDENGMPKALCINEPFLGIYKGEGQRAAALYTQILETL